MSKKVVLDYENINRRGWMAAIVVILFIAGILQWRYINEFPQYIHAWAQADWYSLAIGYVDNGLDFFHPQTMLYNKQDTGLWDSPITSVDFPIHEYVVALLMKLLGTTSPWVFRLWTLVIGMVGMFFLYKLTYLFTDDCIKSLAVVGVAMTAPAYAYYFSGFLPAIPSVTFSIIGLWAYFSYVKKKKNAMFHIGLASLTLAAMIRTPQLVLLMAVCGFEALRIFRGETGWRDKVLTMALLVCCFVGFHLWNRHLQSVYGSMFLGSLMPARNLEEAREVYQNIHDRWMFHYFQRVQHWLVLSAALSAIGWALVKGVQRRRGAFPNADSRTAALSHWWFWGIYLLGTLLYVGAMLRQYSDHDYYFIDSLFLPIVVLLILVLAELPRIGSVKWGVVFGFLLVMLLAVMGQEARQMQQLRRDANDGSRRCYEHFIGADQLLDQADVSRDAKVVALFVYPKSSAFIQMRRRGYIVLDTKEELVRKALSTDHDLIVIENDVLRQEFDAHGYALKYLRPIAANENIMACTLSDTPVAENAEELIEIALQKR